MVKLKQPEHKMENKNENTQIIHYGKEYSQSKFLDKIAHYAKKAGVKTVYAALILYYALFDKGFPVTQRAVIIGALGYFIFPIDLIPDAVPVLGYTDDLAALIYALKIVWDHITPEVKEKAREKVKSTFKEVRDEDFVLFGEEGATK